MPTNCVVGGCSRTSKDKSASFYGFPSKSNDASRRNKWVQFVRSTRKDFTGPGSSHNMRIKVCDAHFEDSAFKKRYDLTESLRKDDKSLPKFTRKLNENAVPTKRVISIKTPTTSSRTRQPRRLPSTYQRMSDVRARTHVSTVAEKHLF